MLTRSSMGAAIAVCLFMIGFQSRVWEYLVLAAVTLGAGFLLAFAAASWGLVLLLVSLSTLGVGLSLERRWRVS
jgi:uncharacterized membrane protein